MPSRYILPNEYPVYGLPNTTTDSQVYQASLLIDAYLLRQEGMVYATDYLNQPCYMAGLAPNDTFTSSGSIAPGNKVNVPLTINTPAYSDMIGEVVILDRANPASTEACVISAMTPGNIQLASVTTAHSSGCLLETGLTIFEEKNLPSKRSIARVSRPPKRVISGLGRYGYGRRTDQIMGMYNEVNLLAAIQTFGGPPMWEPFDISIASVSETTREIWIPAGILMAYFTEVRLRYVSGFTQAALPPIIKQATANLITALNTNSELQGSIKSIKAGAIEITRFAPSQLDADTVRMLNAYRLMTVV